MKFDSIIKHVLSERNPFAVLRRKKMRDALNNITPTFLCPNCIGGILFHDLGVQFRSPTVNTMILQTDFVKFILDLNKYMKMDLVFFEHPELTCPCAKLGDITVHFTHYKTSLEALQKWSARAARMANDNMFVCLMERDGLSEEDIIRLADIKVRGLVVFTANYYPNIPYALQIKKYRSSGEVGNILKKNYWNDGREYEKYFDFVKWFNEANGGDYDVTPFAR